MSAPMEKFTKAAIYPGTFDPITNAHIDLVQRALRIFDKVIVAVAYNVNKITLFSFEERLQLVKEVLKNFGNKVEIESLEGLLVDFVRKKETNVVIRGIRAISDFEYEFQMALMNRKLDPEIETLFMMPSEEYSYLSSKLVKEIAQLGGNVTHLVPAPVIDALKKKYKNLQKLNSNFERK